MRDKTAVESNANGYEELQQVLDSLQGVTYYSNVPSGKVYRAFMSQSAVTSSPAQTTVLQNTTGATVSINFFDNRDYRTRLRNS